MSARKAATDARNFLHQFRNLVAFAESVQELGNVEARIEESKGLKTALSEELAAADKECKAVRAKAKTAKAALELLELTWPKRAQELADEAAKLKAVAKQEISGMKKTAQAGLEKVRALAEKEREAHDLWCLNAQTEKDELSAALNTLKGEMEALREKLL